ncbi:hypothetical protein Tco_0363269 [Tanacetum coccineum]
MHSLLDRSVCCSWRDNPSISMYCHWRHLYAQMSNALGQNVNNKALPVNPHGFEGIFKDGDGVRSIKVKEYQRSFRHSDTECLSRSDEVLKLKNFKKDASLKLSSYQIKKGMSMSVQKSRVHKIAKFTRWRKEIMLG